MKKVNLHLEVKASMTEADGKVMAVFNGGPFDYLDIGYDSAVKIQESFVQSMGDHMARLLAMGHAHATELATKK